VRPPNTRPSRRRLRARRAALLTGVGVLVAGGGWALAHRGGNAEPAATAAQGSRAADAAAQTHVGTSSSSAAGPARLVVHRLGSLPTPLQDLAVAALGDRVYAFGGLDAGQASSAGVEAITGGRVRALPGLPTALHDAAAAALGGRLYVMGGGQSVSYAGIGRYDAATSSTHLVGALPTPLSDLAVARLGATAYVVGGFTGQVFAHSILAYRGGGAASAVGRLPYGLRYAAVAALGGRILIAGGRTEAGPSRAVLAFDPASGRVTRIGSLPQPLMHASAGVIGKTAYVVGGITAGGGPTDQVVAIDGGGRTHVAGHLPSALSDAGVAAARGGLVVVGGADANGPVASVLDLRVVRVAKPGPGPRPPAAHHRRSHPAGGSLAMFKGPLPGDLLIADRGNNRMLIVNPAHKVLWQFPRPGSGVTLKFDDDTFFTPSGTRIIANEEENHDIIKVTYPGGRLVYRYGHSGVPGSSPGYMNTPDDAYALPGGMVIVADAYNCRVLELRGTRIVRILGHTGVCAHNPPYSFGDINGDTPLRNGHVLVSEINGGYIDDLTLSGRLVHVYQAPVSYASDPQLTVHGNIIVADYSRPGGVVIIDHRTGKLLWSYRPTSGPGMLDHPSLAAMLPNGDVIVGDDFNDRVIVIDPHTNRIVWQYGHTAVGGTAPGYLHVPDGFEFIPVTASGRPDPAMIWKTRR
jgi:outer membrane protein assembly factor BamB